MPIWHRPSAGMDSGKQASLRRCPFGILPHLVNAADDANMASSSAGIGSGKQASLRRCPFGSCLTW